MVVGLTVSTRDHTRGEELEVEVVEGVEVSTFDQTSGEVDEGFEVSTRDQTGEDEGDDEGVADEVATRDHIGRGEGEEEGRAAAREAREKRGMRRCIFATRFNPRRGLSGEVGRRKTVSVEMRMFLTLRW